jgi:NADH-quinone oxidoreductase subunit C/D
MFSWKEFEKSKNVISHFGGTDYRDESGQHHVRLRPRHLLDWVEFLKEDLGFFTLCEIAVEDLGTSGPHRYELIYHFLNMGNHQRINLHLLASLGEVIPSISKFFFNAAWLEGEQCERTGIAFDGKGECAKSADPMPIPPLRYNPNKSEAPYPEESYRWELFGPFSPITQGHFEWLVCFDPVRVVDSRIRTGLYHQGLEELFEQKDVVQILQLADKINLSHSPTYSVAWAKCIEDVFRIKIPERAQAIRIVLLEFARIADHLTVLHEMTQLARQEEHKLFLNAREKIYELFERFTGTRLGYGAARIGGVLGDLPYGWIVEYQGVAETLLKILRAVHRSLVSKPEFRDLLNGDSVNAQFVLQWGVSGPNMRAAGLNFDLRKSQPFYFYQDIDFDIPVGIHGTSYDRYLIRMEEVFQSFRIVTQVLDNLPLGEIIFPEYDKNYFELMSMFSAVNIPDNWNYSALEAPNGEAGFLVKLGKNLRPSRLKIKTPSFALAQALPIFVKGLKKEQLPVCLASLGLSRTELDR